MLLQPANPAWALALIIDGMAVTPYTILICAAACQTYASPHRLLMGTRMPDKWLCPFAQLLGHMICRRADCCRALKLSGMPMQASRADGAEDSLGRGERRSLFSSVHDRQRQHHGVCWL